MRTDTRPCPAKSPMVNMAAPSTGPHTVRGSSVVIRDSSVPGGKLRGMTGSDPKADLHRYLQAAREAVLWKLDGLSEYDSRRPLTPTGTNLLGLVKHLAGVELGYFGDTFGRPSDEPLPWFDDDAEPN